MKLLLVLSTVAIAPQAVLGFGASGPGGAQCSQRFVNIVTTFTPSAEFIELDNDDDSSIVSFDEAPDLANPIWDDVEAVSGLNRAAFEVKWYDYISAITGESVQYHKEKNHWTTAEKEALGGYDDAHYTGTALNMQWMDEEQGVTKDIFYDSQGEWKNSKMLVYAMGSAYEASMGVIIFYDASGAPVDVLWLWLAAHDDYQWRFKGMDGTPVLGMFKSWTSTADDGTTTYLSTASYVVGDGEFGAEPLPDL